MEAIKVPELENVGLDPKRAIDQQLLLLKHFVEALSPVYGIGALNDINSYTLGIICKLIKQVESYILVRGNNKDYNTSCSIIRMLADTVASFKLIYGCSDADERLFRHYLYVLDGVSLSKKELSVIPEKNDSISTADYKALKLQMEEAYNNRVAAENAIENLLSKHPYIKLYPDIAQTLIKKRNWKYKDIANYNDKSGDSYSWNGLYAFLGGESDFQNFMSYLSQYAHGLSMSNLQFDASYDEFYSLDFFIFHLIYVAGGVCSKMWKGEPALTESSACNTKYNKLFIELLTLEQCKDLEQYIKNNRK